MKPAGFYKDDQSRTRPIAGKQTTISDFVVRQENAARKKLLSAKDRVAEKLRLTGNDYSAFERELHPRFLSIVSSMYSSHSFDIQQSRVNVDSKTAARVVKQGKLLTLEVHPYFLDLTKEQQDAVLRHEALHIAFQRHDSRFRFHARVHKAPFVLAEIFNIPHSVMLIDKDKSEKEIKSFPDYDRAYHFAKNYLRDNRGKGHKLYITQIAPPELKEKMKLFNF